MAGGKLHGGGGHGRYSREMRKKLIRQEEATARIARAKEKNLRAFEKRFEEAKEFIKTQLDSTAQIAVKNIESATQKRKINPTQGLIRMLAVDAWFFENAMKKAEEKRLAQMTDPEELHLLEKSEREKLWNLLTGKHKLPNGKTVIRREIKTLKEDIQKWKGRVPHMAKGSYF
jgi:hypothetical protein